MTLERISPASRVAIDHIVDTHPEIDDDVWLLTWIDRPAARVVCEACLRTPAEAVAAATR